MTYAYDNSIPDGELTGPGVPGPGSCGVTTDERLPAVTALTTTKKPDLEFWSPVALAGRAKQSLGHSSRRLRPSGGEPTGRRLGGLDGLRAFAVLSVVFFHLDYLLLPGGFLGVDVFFVISGFLITNLLATEILDRGGLRLGRFYLRRARRLLPTVLALLIVVSITSATIWRDQLATLKGGVLSSLFYVTNWWLIGDHQSYFVSTGRPTMVQHLWSLAIEEQYYIVWSLVVMAIAGLLVRRARALDQPQRLRAVVLVAFVLAVASTLVMAAYAMKSDLPYGGSTSRVYFGSDTHTMGLFLGSAAGAWLALRRIQPAPPAWLNRRWTTYLTDGIGVCALATVVYEFREIDQFSPTLYRGGFLYFDAVVLLTILCAVRRGSIFGRLLDMRPIRWVGQRSYSIYIWHWPVVVVTRPGLDVHGSVFLLNVARLALILGLSALSYQFVEVPLRAGGYRKWRAQRRRPTRRGWSVAAVVTSLAAAMSLVLAANPVDASNPPPLAQPPGSITSSASAPTHHQPLAGPRHRRATRVRHGRHISHTTRPAPPRPALSAFGDSVLLGAQSALRGHTKILDLDAVEGRQAYDVLNDVRADAKAGSLRPNVLIHVGDNGIVDGGQLRATLAALADRTCVVLMTVRVPREWEGPDNGVISGMRGKFPNVDVVDWRSLSGAHPDWFYSDGIHLTPAGATGYMQMVVKALKTCS